MITIQTIPHKDQAYDTVGDWQWRQNASGGEDLFIFVSDMGNWRYELLAAVHELVEVFLCKISGISQQEVERFDHEFEACRVRDGIPDWMGPGDSLSAPYHSEHEMANTIERIFASFLGVDWVDYSHAVESL